jgi:hypothetical protein
MSFIGRKVIVRTYSAGVHYGTLAKQDGAVCILENARRIWYWDGAFTLSALATEGTQKPQKCKFSCYVPEIEVERIEIIPCSLKAIESIEGVKSYEV